jgi:tetratricopeptide (TPR) repeat protein
MEFLNRLLGRDRANSPRTESQKEGARVYVSVSNDEVKNYYSGDKVNCSLCSKDITVYLAERHSIVTLSIPNSPKLYAIQFDDFGNLKPFDTNVLQKVALRCIECSTVFCWNCSCNRGTQCPRCSNYGQPYWFTHLRTSPLYPDEYTKLHDYAISLHRKGQHIEALEYYRNVLLFPKKVKEAPYSDGATILTHMGNIYDALQQFQQAINHYEMALTILKDAFGDKHLIVATVYNNAGLSYLAINPNKSKEYIEAALTIMHKELGKDHPQTKQTEIHLATIMRNSRS